MEKFILFLSVICLCTVAHAQTEIPAAKPEIAYAYKHPVLTADNIHFGDTQISMSDLRKVLQLTVVLNPKIAVDTPVICKIESFKMTLITKAGVYEGTFSSDQAHWDYLLSKAQPSDYLMITDIKFYNPIKAVSQYCENAIFKLVE